MRENDITSNKPMINYFDTQIAKMDQKLDLFLESVQEVELSLRSVEEQATMGSIGGENLTALTGGVGGRQDARRLNRTLREFNDALKDVSGRIVDSKDGIRALRSRR
jgi:nucleoporin p58/p45